MTEDQENKSPSQENPSTTEVIPNNAAEKPIPKKIKKIEDEPFDIFINNHFIPNLKESINKKGGNVLSISLSEDKMPIAGGICSIIYCELEYGRRFWLCFSEQKLTSQKSIMLAESVSEPSIIESFLIDERKTTLPLLTSRVLQRLNGQKWLGKN